MATQQIAVRLPEELLAEVDELVARGIYDSRAAAVRAGLVAQATKNDGVKSIGPSSTDRRIPAGETEDEAAVPRFWDAILDEPW